MSPRVVVISSGWKPPTRRLCERSVAAQTGVTVEHRCIDASQQARPEVASVNQWGAAQDLPPETICALVDLDDWLMHPGALARAAHEHQRGAWVTYGSFVHSDGRPGFAAPYAPGEPWRTTPWRATHLKTMRAGLLQHIPREALDWKPGEPIDRAVDLFLMFACLELAGHDRASFIADPLYVYNLPSSFEATAAPSALGREKIIERWVRSRSPYERIASL